MNENYYYDIKTDLEKYPNCWCYLIVGGRNTGKTYSTLRYMKEGKHNFIFIKRTNLDVNNLCAGGHLHNKKLDMDIDFDLSPFADLNDDFGWNVGAIKIHDGLGGFFDYSADNELVSTKPIGYIFSLNRVAKFKGFGGLRSCEFMVFDEFIAQAWERISREEGNQMMDLYKTVARDRVHRGKEDLKIIGLANANDISNPIFNTLKITDDVAYMVDEGLEYLETRGIMIHLIEDSPEFYETESKTKVYEAMHNTVWGKMAYDNEFSRNDFSCIRKFINIKKAVPDFSIRYEGETWYVYRREDEYLVTYSRHKSKIIYNFDIEGDRRRFNLNELPFIQHAVSEGKALFNTYRMYDVLYHFRDNFKL